MTRALRVLHIASGDLWAGAEVQAFTLISHLARMPETEVAAVLMNDETLAHRLRSIGISTYVLDEQRVHSLEIFLKLAKVLRSWQPDVIHTHRRKENILGSIANRLCSNVPCVRTVHGGNELTGVKGWKGASSRALTSLDHLCGRALQQRMIAVTEELGVRMREDFPVEKIAVIENGVDFEEVRMEKGIAEYRLADPDVKHIGIAGRLVEVKRVDLFIETAALLIREHAELRLKFHVFGDGPMRQSLEELSDRLETGDNVVFHGHRKDMATCVGGLDVLLICSDHEGMPMISLEAASLGVPMVAHAVGGLLHVVPEEFLITRHDPVGYRDGILRALGPDSRDIAERRANATLSQFSAQRNAERVRALYEHLVAEN
jgi:L-malate glycosyltransferase